MLVHVYIKNVSLKEMKERKENKKCEYNDLKRSLIDK